ncbi:MAG: DUF3467 domain-containing protein [Nitrospinota bacterium]
MSDNGRQKPSEEQKTSPDEISGLPPQAQYFNHMIIQHSAEEVYFDIAQIVPGTQIAVVSHRFVTNVHHAKRILEALKTNLAKYEKKFGRIPLERKPKQAKRKIS